MRITTRCLLICLLALTCALGLPLRVMAQAFGSGAVPSLGVSPGMVEMPCHEVTPGLAPGTEAQTEPMSCPHCMGGWFCGHCSVCPASALALLPAHLKADTVEKGHGLWAASLGQPVATVVGAVPTPPPKG